MGSGEDLVKPGEVIGVQVGQCWRWLVEDRLAVLCSLASGVGEVHELAAVVVGVGGAMDQASRFELVDADGRGWWVGIDGACDLSQGHRTVGELDQQLDLRRPEIEGGVEGTPAVLSGDGLVQGGPHPGCGVWRRGRSGGHRAPSGAGLMSVARRAPFRSAVASAQCPVETMPSTMTMTPQPATTAHAAWLARTQRTDLQRAAPQAAAA